MAPHPPSPLGQTGDLLQSPLRLSDGGNWMVVDQTPPEQPRSKCCICSRNKLAFSMKSFLSIYTKCVLCVVREFVQNFYMPCMYMLSVGNFRHDVSLCLGEVPVVCFSNGICALALCHPWKRGNITCYFFDNLSPRNPDVSEEVSKR